MIDRETEKKIDRIALGNFDLSGHIDMQITNPLTGRPYYKFEDHNMVLDNLYTYLKTLCITAMSTYETVFGGHLITNLTYVSGATPSFAGSHSNYNPSDGPYTQDGPFITNPIGQIIITDDTTSPVATDNVIRGNKIAMAAFNQSADVGSVWGVFSYTKCFETFNRLYKRWDWSSTNGNGKLSKIYLLPKVQFLPRQIDFPFSNIISQNFPSADGYTTLRSYRNYWLYTKVVSQVFYMRVFKLNYGTSSVDYKGEVIIRQSDFNLSHSWYDDKCSLIAVDDTHLKIIPKNYYSNTKSLAVYDIDLDNALATGASEYSCSAVPLYIVSNRDYSSNPRAYVDNSGIIHVFNFGREYLLDMQKGEITYHQDFKDEDSTSYVGGLLGTLCTGVTQYRIIDDVLYIYNPNNWWRISDMKATKAVVPTYSMLSEPFVSRSNRSDTLTHDSDDWYIYTTLRSVNGHQYMQTERVRLPFENNRLVATTERLLPEPVIKNDMPMYVGYTIKFE